MNKGKLQLISEFLSGIAFEEGTFAPVSAAPWVELLEDRQNLSFPGFLVSWFIISPFRFLNVMALSFTQIWETRSMMTFLKPLEETEEFLAFWNTDSCILPVAKRVITTQYVSI